MRLYDYIVAIGVPHANSIQHVDITTNTIHLVFGKGMFDAPNLISVQHVGITGNTIVLPFKKGECEGDFLR